MAGLVKERNNTKEKDKEILKKAKETNNEKYGADYYTQKSCQENSWA